MSVRIGTRLMDRYRLVDELGRGGMGVVYRAVDAMLDREVAVKVISARAPGDRDERRFRREAQLAARLEHPAIVPIYDFGRDGDWLFFVMPLVRGTTLHALIRDRALTLGDALEIVAQTAEALDYSASQGVIHRDVKPENVLVSRPQDTDLRVWVMDFGLALGANDSRITQSGRLPGTLPYLSPEYVLSLELDGRSDLYSLGVVLYECLVGDPPFRGPQGSVLYRIVHEPPPSLASLGVDEDLERLVLACLAKEPDERPQGGRDLAAALRRYRATLGEGVRAPLPVSERSAGPAAKRRRAAAFVGRREELAEIQRRFGAALGGESQLVVVRGETGVGKTRLLEEIEALARARGTQVLWGRFPGHGAAAFPHLGFCELVQDHFRGRSGSSSAAASAAGGMPAASASDAGTPEAEAPGAAGLAELAPELVALFPVLREIPELRRFATQGTAELATTALTGDPTRIYELLARTLLALAGGRPVVFLLENLHSAEASCEALQYVVRRLGPTPTLLVGTYQPSEITPRHPLGRLLRAFRGDPRFLELELGPLAPDDHEELVALLVSESRLAEDPRAVEDLASRLYRASEGNPFFTRELVQALVDAGEISAGHSSSWTFSDELVIPAGPLPETIRQAVESRLERLSEPLLEVLSIASILGRSFDPRDLLALIEDLGEVDGAEEAIDRLLLDGLLEEDLHSRSGRLRFSSGMVCEVLHGKLTRRRRRRLHRLQARRLESRYADRLERVYPQLVYHFSQGDVPVEAVTYALMLARLSAAAFALSETLDAARTALEFLEDVELDDRGEIEGELRLLLARASRLAGNAHAGLREAGKAASAYERAGELTAAAGAALVAAELAWQLRQVEETRRWLAKGIEVARGAGAGAALRRLLTLAATVSNLRGEHRKAQAFLDEVDASYGRASGRRRARERQRPARLPETLRVPVPARFDSLEPALALYVEPAEVLPNVFETLARVDQGVRIVPNLASELRLDDGGRRLRVALREGVRFHDGRPLGARDVRYSFERLLRSPYPGVESALLPIRGARALVAGETDALAGLAILSEHELAIELEEPLAFFPAMLTNPMTAIVPDGTADFAGSWREGCVGTGAFRVVRLDGERLDLEANPHYRRRGYPRSRRLVFELGVEPERAAEGFRSGRFAVASSLEPRAIEALLGDPAFAPGFRESPGFATYFLLLNARRGPFSDPEIRRAFVGALDVGAVLRAAGGRLAMPASGLISPGLLGHETRDGRPDPEAEAVRIERLIGLELKLSVHPAYRGPYAHLWQGLRRAFEELGLDLLPGSETMPEILAEVRQGSVDLVAARRIAAYPDTDALVSIFHSRDGLLGALLGSPQVDRLIEKGRSETHPALRHAIYRELERELEREALLVPLFDEQVYCFARPEVEGLRLRFGWPRIAYEEMRWSYG